MPNADEILLAASDLTVEMLVDTGRLRVLDGVSFGLAAGEVVDVVGPSGSGKSTLLRTLARLMPTAGGALALKGTPADKIAPQLWRSRVALMPQRSTLVAGTVSDNLLLPWRLKVRSGERPPTPEEARAALDELGLADVSLDRDSSRLSVGQQARLAFARVRLTSPDVLLLDEAEASLDDASVEALLSAVKSFVAGPHADKAPSRGVVRVRHAAGDGLASRRLRLEAGRLTEVAS
jgi:putative ABC transport system ATP-binding protein